MAVNAYLVSSMTLIETDVKQFFPDKTVAHQDTLNSEKNRYLFVSTPNPEPLYDLEEKKLIDGIINLPGKEDVFLVFFNENAHSKVIKELSGSTFMGTSIVGSLLSNEFISDLNLFLLFFIPIMIPFLAFFTSVKFVLNSLAEVLAFSVLVLTVITYWEIDLNAAFLLALLFTYIYIFTLINQIYYNKVSTPSLALSLSASLATTALSAFLLSHSGFGIISDFGTSLMIWVLILTIYMGARLFIRVRTPHTLSWLKLRAPLMKVDLLSGFIALFSVSFVVAVYLSPINVNLNPLGLSSYTSDINEFEAKSSLSQPILITIKSENCPLRTLECNQKLSNFIHDIENKISLKFEPILDLNTLYTSFTEETFESVTSAKFAQFKLGMDMMSVDRYLYGQDLNSANFIASISLLEPVDSLIELKRSIELLNDQQNDFKVEIEGHLAQIALYQSIFLDEMFWSVLSMLLLLATLFLIFYRRLAVLISLLPAILSISILFFIHSIFSLSLSVMTLIAVILFVGLITDNIIHILMTYRLKEVDCFKTVFKPIILSNLFLILSLTLMALVNQGFLKMFGMELAILLTAHLLFLIFLLPPLFLKLMPRKT